MVRSIMNIVVKFIPIRFVPAYSIFTNNTSVPIEDPQRRRSHYAMLLTGRIEELNDKYSPYEVALRIFKKIRFKIRQKYFYSVVGELTLLHAGIEQDIKNILSTDMGLEREEIEWTCGDKLRKKFKKKVNTDVRQARDRENCLEWIQRFHELSDDRNNFVKASYSFNIDTARISLYREQEVSQHIMDSDGERIGEVVVLSKPIELVDSLGALRVSLLTQRVQGVFKGGANWCRHKVSFCI